MADPTPTTTAQDPWPTDEQWLAAVRGAPLDMSVPEGWRGVLSRMWQLAAHRLGVQAALKRLLDSEERITDGELAADPALRLGFYEGTSAVQDMWCRETYAYAHLAQAALDAFATDVVPAGFHTPLDGEDPTHEFAGSTAIRTPEPTLPDALHSLEGSYLIRCALGNIRLAEEAAADYDDLGHFEDDEGNEGFCIPEHMLDDAAELCAEAEKWPELVGEWADAVAYTLATDWRPLLAATTTGAVSPRG